MTFFDTKTLLTLGFTFALANISWAGTWHHPQNKINDAITFNEIDLTTNYDVFANNYFADTLAQVNQNSQKIAIDDAHQTVLAVWADVIKVSCKEMSLSPSDPTGIICSPQRTTIKTSSGTIGQPMGAIEALSPPPESGYPFPGDLELAASQTGDAIVGWRQKSGLGMNSLFIATKNAGIWTKPNSIYEQFSNPSRQVGEFALAISPNGQNKLVSWIEYEPTDFEKRRVYVAEKIGNANWTAYHVPAVIQALNPTWQLAVKVSINDSGKAILAWSETNSDGYGNNHFELYKALRDPTSGQWDFPQFVSDSISHPNPNADLFDHGVKAWTVELNNQGNFMVTYSQHSSSVQSTLHYYGESNGVVQETPSISQGLNPATVNMNYTDFNQTSKIIDDAGNALWAYRGLDTVANQFALFTSSLVNGVSSTLVNMNYLVVADVSLSFNSSNWKDNEAAIVFEEGPNKLETHLATMNYSNNVWGPAVEIPFTVPVTGTTSAARPNFKMNRSNQGALIWSQSFLEPTTGKFKVGTYISTYY